MEKLTFSKNGQWNLEFDDHLTNNHEHITGPSPAYGKYLTKSAKPDSASNHKYSDKEISSANNAATDAHHAAHLKLWRNANPNMKTGDEASDSYRESMTHYMKTGKALKHGTPQSHESGATIRAGVKNAGGAPNMGEVKVPKITGPKGKLP